MVRVFNGLNELKGSYWPQNKWVDTGLVFEVEKTCPTCGTNKIKDENYDLQKEADLTAELAMKLSDWFAKQIAEGKMTTVSCLQLRNGKILANIG